jgi:hypothetical protein
VAQYAAEEQLRRGDVALSVCGTGSGQPQIGITASLAVKKRDHKSLVQRSITGADSEDRAPPSSANRVRRASWTAYGSSAGVPAGANTSRVRRGTRPRSLGP